MADGRFPERLYFLRHGLADRAAFKGDDDDLRPLTTAGQYKLERCLPAFRRLLNEVDLVLSSPLLRAKQTAEIVAQGVPLDCEVEEVPAVGPWLAPRALAATLNERPGHERVLLVGHEPSFSATISDLIGGGALVCKKGGLARVDLYPGPELRGELVWLLPPRALLCRA